MFPAAAAGGAAAGPRDPLELQGDSSAKVLADAAADSITQLAAIQVNHGGSWLLSLVIEPQQLRLFNQVGGVRNSAVYSIVTVRFELRMICARLLWHGSEPPLLCAVWGMWMSLL